MPSYATLNKWRREDEEWRRAFDLAREDSAEYFADEMLRIAELVEQGSMDAKAARVKIWALMWLAGKRAPKRFGDKLNLDHSSSGVMNFNVSFGKAKGLSEGGK
jgi:hypothetical protein